MRCQVPEPEPLLRTQALASRPALPTEYIFIAEKALNIVPVVLNLLEFERMGEYISIA